MSDNLDDNLWYRNPFQRKEKYTFFLSSIFQERNYFFASVAHLKARFSMKIYPHQNVATLHDVSY